MIGVLIRRETLDTERDTHRRKMVEGEIGATHLQDTRDFRNNLPPRPLSGLRQYFMLFEATGLGTLSCCPRKATQPTNPNRICPEVSRMGRKDAGLPNSEITSPFSERAIHSPAELGIQWEALILILSLWICTHTGTVHG